MVNNRLTEGAERSPGPLDSWYLAG